MSKPPATLTLAEMYVRQGLAGRARAVLRELTEVADGAVAQAARRRLEELGPPARLRVELLETLLQRVRDHRRSS